MPHPAIGALTLKPIVQLGYSVPDVDAAVEHWAKTFGVGPFFVERDVEVQSTYRGKPSVFRNSSAFGQWGDMQIELTQQLDDEPSMLRDICPRDVSCLVSYAWFVDDLRAEEQRMNALGFATAFYCEQHEVDIRAAFFDTRPILGVMAEVYEENAFIRENYRQVAAASIGWDGSRPLRSTAELRG